MRETGTETIELGLTRGKKNMEKIHNIKEEKKKNKIISANTNLFSLQPLNANLNLFYGTRIIMAAKRIPFFFGHKKNTQRKKGIVFKKGQKKTWGS